MSPDLIADAVAYYQFASDWSWRSRRIDTTLRTD